MSCTHGLPKELLDATQLLFGGIRKFPGYRATHAKGLLVEGTFTPTKGAKALSVAAHFSNTSTPVIARFSNDSGIPNIEDKDSRASPKGLAIRFNVSQHEHTDLISHSFNGFAVKTGELFLALINLILEQRAAQEAYDKAISSDHDATAEKAALDKANTDFGDFIKAHPSAEAFLLGLKPNPINYGTLTYYQPNTHELIDEDGKIINARFRLVPADGDQFYPPDKVQDLSRDYLEDDLKQRLPTRPITFTIQAHIAGPQDILDDATVPYTSTVFVTIGTIVLDKLVEHDSEVQQRITFSAAPEVGGIKGIKSSRDPLIQIRNDVYHLGVKQRRAAPPTPPS